MEKTNELGNIAQPNQPEMKFRAGAVCATVWQNQAMRNDGTTGSFNTVSFERGYKDKTGNWKSTTTLRAGDIPKAVVLLNRAYEYLITKSGTAEA